MPNCYVDVLYKGTPVANDVLWEGVIAHETRSAFCGGLQPGEVMKIQFITTDTALDDPASVWEDAVVNNTAAIFSATNKMIPLTGPMAIRVISVSSASQEVTLGWYNF